MRKRNVSFIADKLLWFIILILPLLFAMVFTCASMNNYQLEVSASDYNFTPLSTYYLSSRDLYCCDNPEFMFLQFSDIVADVDDYDGGTFYYSSDNFGYYSDDNFSSFSLITFELNVFISDSPDLDNYVSVSFSGSGLVLSPLDNRLYTFDYFIDSDDSVHVSFKYPLIFSVSKPYERSFGVLSNYSYAVSWYDTISISNYSIFNTYFANLNYSLDNWFTFGERDIVYNAFNSIFGSQSNIMPIFSEGSFIPKYLTYMAWIYVLHLAFDFLVFIPRLAHKWMGGVYNDDE